MTTLDQLYANREMNFAGLYVAGRKFFPEFPTYGREWFVNGGTGALADDGTGGADVNDGKSWTTARRTMGAVFTDALFGSNQVVYFRGNIREELTAPAGVFDVRIIGAGNRPRHSDGHTGNNGYSSATWKPPASPTTATPLLKVKQQGWSFENFLMDCPVDAAGIQLLRDAASGDDEQDAGHASFFGMRFESGLVGIQNVGGAGFCHVKGCRFTRLSGSGAAGIKCTSTSVAVPLEWIIEDNHFHNNASHILSSMSYSTIRRNVFGRFTATLAIDIDDQPSANQGEYNVITGNHLSGTYGATAYPPGSNNEWGGNFNSLSGGVTADDPA